jgi:hypothetical protein
MFTGVYYWILNWMNAVHINTIYSLNKNLNYVKIMLNFVHCLRQGSQPFVSCEIYVNTFLLFLKTKILSPKLYKKCSLNVQ